MNLIFSDVSRSFLNRFQGDLPRSLALDTDTAGSQKPLFADKLNTIFKKEKKAEQALFPQANTAEAQVAAVNDSQTTINSIVEKISSENGIGVVRELKNIFLMLANGNLKTVSIDADGLDALKKILANAGFSSEELDELMSDLSEQVKDKELTLDSFFDQLFELPIEATADLDTGPEIYLETSAIPFVESILNSLGISSEKVQEILTQADRGDQGISLDLVIEKLQGLQKESFYGQTDYAAKQGDDTIRQLFDQLGLVPEDGKRLFLNQKEGLETMGKGTGDPGDATPSALTLDDLVHSLENLRQKALPQSSPSIAATEAVQNSLASEKPLDLFAQLFKGLEVKNTAADTTAVEFSHEQIKNQVKADLFAQLFKGLEVKNTAANTTAVEFSHEQFKAQFKNSVLALGEQNVSQKGFPTDKNGKQPNILEQLKEMASVLKGKPQGAGEGVDSLTENKDAIKQFKSEKARSGDVSMFSASDEKTNGTSADLNSLKSKSGVKNLPTYVTQQVSKSIVRAINQGENTLKIQLKPSELGRLVMTIDHTGNSMKVSIVTDNQMAKDILTSNVTELRTVLSASGVTLERFDVGMNSEFKQSMADARHQPGNSGSRRSNREKQVLNSMNGESINDPLHSLDGISQEGSLHFVA